ncbi:protein MID1-COMPLEMENTING ACTIVITY 1-like isoform X7 [Miscanthus floridulus]|uniref:protein MID1-COMPLEMENTING ACTIVITY 1-like isoform X7 n=1 Tax=Miscanthus floridulus TaxID=154761 RepID=UPI00345AE96C
MASSSWDRVGQAASVMQVTGVDAFGLVNMIVQAAHTARRNRDLCQQLAQHVLIVADLLRKLDIPALRQHLETRRPLELLDAALFRAYKLVRSCAQRQENTSQIYQMFTGAEVASKLRLAQEEIDRYINLIPMITLVAAVGARQATNEVHEDGSNDAAPTQSRLPENRLSLQHVTQSLTLEELQPQGHHTGMELDHSMYGLSDLLDGT